MFELTSMGAILPSYNVETRLIDDQYNENLITYANIAFAMGEPIIEYW